MLNADEGYFFGIGAFETIAVECGRALFLEEHLCRLQRAAAFLGLDFSESEVRKQVQKALEPLREDCGRKALKVTISQENLLVSVRENHYRTEDYERGFLTGFSEVRRNETSPFVAHKTLNYGDNLFEKRRAKARGIDEPIFLNTRGEIAEGATSNVFFVQNGRLYTPPLRCGMLPGIVRDYICRKYPVTEQVIYPQDLGQYEEMFLTNSLLGIMPVVSLAERCFPKREASERLRAEYPKI